MSSASTNVVETTTTSSDRLQDEETISSKTSVTAKRRVCKKIRPIAKSQQQPFLWFEVEPHKSVTVLEDNPKTEEEDNLKDYNQYSDDYDDNLYDDFVLMNMKQGGSFSRSTSAKKQPKVKSNRRVNMHQEMKQLKKMERCKENWADQKVNVQESLHKKGIHKFGFDIYKCRSLTTTTASSKNPTLEPTSRTNGYKSRQSYNKKDSPEVLKYELRKGNIPTGQDYLTRIIDLQHRDLTPEDYELLLLLDDSVAPKTVSSGALESIRPLSVETMGVLGELCTICMEQFGTSEMTKKLPACEHVFHATCIDHWLSSSSQNCPLDGLAVFVS